MPISIGKNTGYSFDSGGGGGSAPVQPPAPTSEGTAADTNFAAKTFGAFTDPDGVIASYSATTINAQGSASWSGSGLGPYTATSSAGDCGTLALYALNSSGDTVATAVHTYGRGATPPAPVQPPSPFTLLANAGQNLLNRSFGSFTDPDSQIASYSHTTVNVTGSTVWNRIQPANPFGYFAVGDVDGVAGTLLLNALDSGGNTLATAVMSFQRLQIPPTPPSPTSESTASGVNFAAKTFGSFTDPRSAIDNYQAVTTNSTGSTSWSGSGLGPYTATSTDGDAGTLSLNARDSNNNILATAVHTYDRASPTPTEPPQPPTPTSEATAAGTNFAAKTFGGFTDPDSVITGYTAVTTNARGSTSWSGSGLGPYTATSADDNAGTLSLNATDADGDVVATAVHSYDRAAPAGSFNPVQPPAATSVSTSSGVNFAAKTFGAFTDPDGLINNYQAVVTNATGSASWSGTGLGPYTATSADDDAGTLALNARDASNEILATAVHTYSRGGLVPTVLTVLDVDWPQLWIDNGSTDVDLSSPGTYTLDGTDYVVDRNGSALTVTLKSSGLHLVQASASSFTYSIALAANQATVIDDYVVITADITATISSRASGTNGAGVYAAGYTTTPTWGSAPGNNAIGGGLRIVNNSSYDRTCVVRNTTANGASNRVSKVNPTTFNHRWYATGTDYMGAVNSSAFTNINLVEATASRMGSTYTLPNSNYPFQHAYRTNGYPMFWTSGNGNLDLDLLVTRTTWLAWPTDG